MTGGSPGNPPPLPDEPWLEALTFEQAAQLVMEVSPEVFYLRASAFDQAGARLQDVLDQVRHEMNLLREVWHGTASDDFDALMRDVTRKVAEVMQFLHSPGYGATLRGAGDRLADHQQRLRDLAGLKAQQESAVTEPGGPSAEMITRASGDSAKQILRDLRTSYWDIGNSLPGFAYKPPTTEVGDPNKVDAGDGGTSNGPPSQHNQHGSNDPAMTDGQTPPGQGHQNITTTPNLFGPGPVLSTMYSPPGPHGDNRSGFDGRTGPGEHTDQVLGRSDPGGQERPGGDGDGDQEWFASGLPGVVGGGGREWLGPGGRGQEGFGPGMPGGMVFTGGAAVPEVLGQKPLLRKVSDPVGNEEPGEAPVVAAPAVLGRSGLGAPAAVGLPDRTTSKPKEVKKVAAERRELVENRPETVSAEIHDPPLVDPKPVTIRTAVDAPVPPAPGDQEPQVAHAAVPVGIAVTPQGVPDPPPLAPAPKSDVDPELRLAMSHGGNGGGVVPAATVDPEARGWYAPGTAALDGLPSTQAPGTPPAGGGTAAPRTDPYAPSNMGGGFPMTSMMFGGMGGGMQQQNGRMAAMPNESRPELWDPVTGQPVAVGRRVPEPEPRDRDEPKLSKEEIQARLAEKFAELDRLTQRRNDGGN